MLYCVLDGNAAGVERKRIILRNPCPLPPYALLPEFVNVLFYEKIGPCFRSRPLLSAVIAVV